MLQLSKTHLLAVVSGLALVVVGFLLPADWRADMVAPIDATSTPTHGLLWLKACFFVEGIWCLYLGLTKWRWKQLADDQLFVPRPFESTEVISSKTAGLALSGIVITALVLRCITLDSSLWLDEITPLSFYRETSLTGLLTTYFSTNNHLLYTILEKLMVTCFGESEAVVRLPAVLFGVATVPVVYLLSRSIAPRIVSLGVAFLLAVSYHHVFFSQNARGYSPHLFFSLAATLFLVRALKNDRMRNWFCYCLCMVLNLAAIIASLSMLIAHMVIDGLALLSVSRRGVSPLPLFLRFSSFILLTLVLFFHLYSVILPQAYQVMQATYHVQAAGFSLLSAEFAEEVARGLKIAAGPIFLLAAVPALFIAGLGAVTTARASWILFCSLLFSELLLASYLLFMNLAVSPRFFLLSLPFALLIAAVGIYSLCKWLGTRVDREWLVPYAFVSATFVISMVNFPLLSQYYRTPKQDYRSAALYLKSVSSTGSIDVAIYTAKEGFGYYAKRSGLKENVDFFDIRTMPDFNLLLQQHDPKKVYLVTTFPRALHLDHPELEIQIDKHWVVDKVFPGSIGDGDITVWKPR